MEIDIADPEVTSDDVVFNDESEEVDNGLVGGATPAPELDDGVAEDDEDVELETREEKWKEADCRIIVNVRDKLTPHVEITDASLMSRSSLTSCAIVSSGTCPQICHQQNSHRLTVVIWAYQAKRCLSSRMPSPTNC